MSWPKAALLSLSDRSGAAGFAAALASRGTRIIASGGTARHLEQAGISVTAVESWTGFDALLGGRVKTLHPHVHAPILARRSVPEDLEEIESRGLEPIDLVAVSLYPFESRAASLDEEGAIEEIDIGGVALLRAAAKNHADVIVVPDPARYPEVLRALEAGGPTREERRAWALETFARTARYDAAIAADLERRGAAAGESSFPRLEFLTLERVRSLRYGENPHQPAALYGRLGEAAALQSWREGRELSYNNLLDLEAAVSLVSRFAGPACVIVKHGQPCGAAVADSIEIAYRAAYHADELSAYGGVVAFNRTLDPETAAALGAQYVECVAAPGFDPEVAAAFKSKKNLRAVRLSAEDVTSPGEIGLRLAGRWVLAERVSTGAAPPWRVVTRRAPSPGEAKALEFAWELASAARSNAIAIARETALLGLGSGQTSRVDAVDVAILKARRSGHQLLGASLASDGFFPFADNIEHAERAGITAVIQPGGSMRDAEVIEACDRLGIAMVFTDRRTFRH